MITIGDAFVTKDSHKAYKVINKHHLFEGVWKCYPADKEPPYKDSLVDCFAGEFIEQCLNKGNEEVEEKIFNKRVAELRKRLGYTQQSFADLLGINVKLLGSYEEMRAFIPYKLVPKIVDVLGIPKQYIYPMMFEQSFKYQDILYKK